MSTAREQSATAEARVVSADGTEIAFEQSGIGPAVVLVASALADRSDTTKLAALLAQHFTVINYDRRGRGASGDANATPPTARLRTLPP
ncbi:pimeloyl-ACP methyl ester carboxylesterase [Streptomyces sp. TE3672]